MRKILLFILLIVCLVYATRMLDNKLSEGFFDSFDGTIEHSEEVDKVTTWEKISDYIKDLFADKEEKYIYR